MSKSVVNETQYVLLLCSKNENAYLSQKCINADYKRSHCWIEKFENLHEKKLTPLKHVGPSSFFNHLVSTHVIFESLVIF